MAQQIWLITAIQSHRNQISYQRQKPGHKKSPRMGLSIPSAVNHKWRDATHRARAIYVTDPSDGVWFGVTRCPPQA